MAGRPSTPEDEPPRRQGGRLASLIGTLPGLVALAFVVIVIVVLFVVAL